MAVRADLVNPGVDPDDGGDFSTLALVELRCREIARWILKQLPAHRARIVEVGCGNGYLALEMARAGHTVEAIDQSEQRIENARKTLAAADRGSHFGTLRLQAIDAQMWRPDGDVDVLVFNRSLHHLPEMTSFLESARRAMPRSGLVLCNEYAWDRFDKSSAEWFAAHLRRLRAEGLELSAPVEQAAALLERWRGEAMDEGLSTFDQIMRALRDVFEEGSFSENPYLFANIAREIRTEDAEEEMRLTAAILDDERFMIQSGKLNPAGFRFTGTVRPQRAKS